MRERPAPSPGPGMRKDARGGSTRMSDPGWARVATLRDAATFRRHLDAGLIPLAFDEALEPPATSPFARPLEADGLRVGNRFCVLPMEGWDGTASGEPTELTERRWRNFGRSGAKLVWGGEAVAVRHDGRANPHQLLIGEATWEKLAAPARGPRRRARGAGRPGGLGRPRRRAAAHALGPLLAAERVGPPRAARGLRTTRCSTRATRPESGCCATRSSSGWSRTSSARRCSQSAPASRSST